MIQKMDGGFISDGGSTPGPLDNAAIASRQGSLPNLIRFTPKRSRSDDSENRKFRLQPEGKRASPWALTTNDELASPGLKSDVMRDRRECVAVPLVIATEAGLRGSEVRERQLAAENGLPSECVDSGRGCAHHGSPACRSRTAYRGDWARTVRSHHSLPVRG